MGGINHWAYIIQMLRHFVIILTYNGSIQFAVNYNPVYICRQKMCIRDRNSSTDRPMGVIAPIPVTTTLLLISASQSAAQTACNHIRNGQIAIPPSTEITCPVIYAPPSPARKATSSATSSGRPSLFRGICEIIPCFASSDIAAVISVAI